MGVGEGERRKRVAIWSAASGAVDGPNLLHIVFPRIQPALLRQSQAGAAQRPEEGGLLAA